MPINMTCPSCGKALRAPDGTQGRQAKCPACGTMMTIPAPAPSIEAFGAEEIHDDYALAGGGEPAPGGAADGDPGRRPCPICGEMIAVAAAKCRFCQAIFDPALRAAEEKKKVKPEDADLTTSDWVLCVICSGIMCIVGIVYLIQGKPKAGKMIGVSLLFAVLWNVLSALIQASMRQGMR